MAAYYSLDASKVNQVTLAASVGALILLTALFKYLFHKEAFPKNTPPLTSLSWPIVGSLGFFTHRADWVKEAQAESKTGHFSFYAGQHPVIGICGRTEEPRKFFFEDRRLGFNEGYQALLAGAPSAESNKMATGEETTEMMAFVAKFKARLTAMMRGNKLSDGLQGLLQDVNSSMKTLAANPRGLTDPFESIYRIVYQLTMRNVGCKEVADSPEMINKTLGLFEDVEGSSNALMIMFPWLPLWNKVRRMYSGVRLYLIFKKLVEKRQKEGRREDDAVQYLLDQGDSLTDTIQFVVAALFSGQLNTGINAAWIVICLSRNPEWKARIRQEVEAAADKYSPDKSRPLPDRLMRVPFTGWEEDFPMIYLCLRETIRLTLPGTYFRRNVSDDDIPIPGSPGYVIPGKGYVAMAVGDMHHNPSIFKDSDQWDPSRYFPDRAEDKKQTYAWTGWGQGRHPCLGTRFAKLETNVIIAFWVAYFDEFSITDKNGDEAKEIPQFEKNNFSARKPPRKIYVKYRGYESN